MRWEGCEPLAAPSAEQNGWQRVNNDDGEIPWRGEHDIAGIWTVLDDAFQEVPKSIPPCRTS